MISHKTQMIPEHVKIILYGFNGDVPEGGFPTLGYTNVMSNIEKIRTKNTIFPKEAYNEICLYYYWAQRTRWAFKKLLLFWYYRKYKNADGNDEDLYGNAINEINPENVLRIWDWRSKRHYNFSCDELIGLFKTKLKDNIKPKNPYNNLPFTYSQCAYIHNFLMSYNFADIVLPSPVLSYTRFPDNMYLNTQLQMQQCGYPTLKDRYTYSLRSMGEVTLLREVIGDHIKVKLDKVDLLSEIENILYLLILYESDNVCFVPDTKLEKCLYGIYCKYGLNKTIKWIKDWKLINKKIYRIRRDCTPNMFVCTSTNTFIDT